MIRRHGFSPASSRRLAASALAVAVAAIATLAVAAGSTLWECNYCHQQYQGNTPPPFAKCPAKEMKQNHWWIRKH